QIRLLLENHFGRHRFGGVALPADAATRLDIRGNLKGHSIHAPDQWSGQLYAQVSGARFASWGQWVPWAQQAVKDGQGDVRFWLDLAQGKAIRLTGDALLHNVAVNIQPGLPDLRFAQIGGRLGWGRSQDMHTLFVEKLRFSTPGNPLSKPANLRLRLQPDAQGGVQQVEVKADNLQLEALTALSSALPLPRRSHDLIAALAPRGLVEHAEGRWRGRNDYAVRLKIEHAGMQPFQHVPGFSGLNARLEANQQGGHLDLSSSHLALQWPQLFRHNLGFSKLVAQTDWQFRQGALELSYQLNQLSNADLDGTSRGRLRFADGEAPVVDLSAHLRRGEANAVYRYLPHPVADDAYEWLKRSLVSGHSDDVRLTLKGNLHHFPFHQGGGDFKVGIRMVNGVLDYAPGWPRIEGINGHLLFHDRAMSLTADTGRILATSLGPVRVVIPDLHGSDDEVVLVEGHASGETAAFLDFIRQSPVSRYTGGLTDPFRAEGQGNLQIKLTLPVRRIADSTVGGLYSMTNNSLLPGADMPLLSEITGQLSFTEKQLQAKEIAVKVHGLPTQLDLNSSESGLQINLRGDAQADALRAYLPGLVANRLQGSTRWLAHLGLNNAGQPSPLSVTSNLLGLSLDLPAPLGKRADQAIPLQIEHQNDTGGNARLKISYGSLGRARVRLPKNGDPAIQLRLGEGEPDEASERGLWITGTQKTFNLDLWRHFDWGPSDAQTGKAHGLALFRQANLNFEELRMFNRRFSPTQVRLLPAGKGWNVRFSGKELKGEIATVPEEAGTRVMASFKRLALPESEPGVSSSKLRGGDQTALTNVDINVQSLAWQKRELGELHLRLSPVSQGLRVDNFLLIPPEGRVEGTGLVASTPHTPTELKLTLGTRDLGKLLDRFGYEEAVRGGEAELNGTVTWPGGLESFDLQTLKGDLQLRARQGQFLKADPGAGRLIAILSLQALPRRITLDFRDVFSQGFTFDEITGQVSLNQGEAEIQNLHMSGPAAKISMTGAVDLLKEGQNLKLQIQPRLEDTLAVAGALLGGPVTGLSAYLANKLLMNPLGQVSSYEYAVTGTWKEPQITKVQRPTPKTPNPLLE
ncbi:MAG: TIGR02099 family protein, partial [Sulfuricella sp.]|nr:TIGR02099 family protein [Sulfuricella sp.]